ncbi:MAG TPA: ABC transporter transmembrane domain-containing protein [Stellaceae bacterium]|nr:ABC transporter transmembrane domain-containing protein [Stellaceae bacterium]
MSDQPIAAEALGVAPPPAHQTPAATPGPQPLDRSIYRFILRYSLTDQITVCLLTALSMPFYYYSLELPKLILNTINGNAASVTLFGWQLDQIRYLLILCTAFLTMVVVNNGFKYFINVLKGRLGERMLRRLRFELYHRVLRFPHSHFRHTSAGEIIPMITSELEPLGGFIGDAFALPAQQGGLLLTAIIFLFAQDVYLAAAALALYPFQAYAIPRLQAKVNALDRTRIRTIRSLADRVGETVNGIADIQSNDATRYQLTDFADRLGTMYWLRLEIFIRKFFIEFLNQFINQLVPFFFFAIGGYFVIRGQLSIGALVAVLAAFKDMSPPWKELLDFYQMTEDLRIKYEQVVEQFQPPNLIDHAMQMADPEPLPELHGTITTVNLGYADEDRRLLDGVSVTLPLDQHVAVVGRAGSGKNEFAMLLARLMPPTEGHIRIGDIDVATLPYAVTGRRFAYVGPSASLFSASLRDNLLFGLRQRPIAEPPLDPSIRRRRERALREARRAGNIPLDISDDWVDYARGGIAAGGELTTRLIDVLKLVGLDRDVYLLGLNGRLDVAARPDIAERLLEARQSLREFIAERRLESLVEYLDPDRYNSNMSVAENLLFGTPLDATFRTATLPENAYVQSVLDKVGLTADLVQIGIEVAETMIELFGDVKSDARSFDEYRLIPHDELPEFQEILMHARKAGPAGKGGPGKLKPADRVRLLALAFKLIEPQHRLGLIDQALRGRVLEARRVFAEGLTPAQAASIELFDVTRYNTAASLQSNVLFGSIAYGEAESVQRVRDLIEEVLDRLELRDLVIEVGLDAQVGSGGARLSPVQRQKAAIACGILKRPDMLILNDAFAVLDPGSVGTIIACIRAEFAGRGLLAVVNRTGLARGFDRVLVMVDGHIVQDAEAAALDQPDTPFAGLSAAD